MSARITIGLCAYNAAGTIGRAVRSALAQDWPDKEIVIVDDHSDDDTWDIIQSFSKVHPDILALRNPANVGPGGTRQKIIETASGAYIAFFDDDDESLPQRIRRQYDRLHAYPHKMAACYAGGERHYANGYKKRLPAIGVTDPAPHGEAMAARILYYGGPSAWRRQGGTPACAVMAGKHVFEALGGFDPAMRRCEDLDFAVRLALAGGYFIGCDETLFIQHATHAQDKNHAMNRDAEIKMAQKYAPFLRETGMAFYARQWPLIRYYHFQRQYARLLAALLPLLIRYPVKTLSHLLSTGPARLRHERNMAA